MSPKLKDEIKQGRPFESLEAEVFLNLMRTADALSRGVEEILKLAGLSHTQYNVLRILRGAGEQGLCCREVAERMITRDPDITRLLDRLERRGLLTRSRDSKDRRVITVRITPAGLKVLEGPGWAHGETQPEPVEPHGQRRPAQALGTAGSSP